MEIALADFLFPGAETPRDRDTPKKCWGELSEDEIRFLSEIKKYSTTLSEGDKTPGFWAMIRKMATVYGPPPTRQAPSARRFRVLAEFASQEINCTHSRGSQPLSPLKFNSCISKFGLAGFA